MQKSVPKQYLLLAGKPVIIHSLERLDELDEISEIVVVVSRNIPQLLHNCSHNTILQRKFFLPWPDRQDKNLCTMG